MPSGRDGSVRPTAGRPRRHAKCAVLKSDFVQRGISRRKRPIRIPKCSLLQPFTALHAERWTGINLLITLRQSVAPHVSSVFVSNPLSRKRTIMRTFTTALLSAALVSAAAITASAPASARQVSDYSRAAMTAQDQAYPSVARFDACRDLAVQRGDSRLESRHEYEAFMDQCEAGQIR
jgi:hypothetical protein